MDLFFCALVLLWFVCVGGTLAKVNNTSLLWMVKQLCRSILNLILPKKLLPSELDKMKDSKTKEIVLHNHLTHKPFWVKIFQENKRYIADEIVQHYLQCPSLCLSSLPYSTRINSHYHFTNTIHSHIKSIVKETHWIDQQFIYIGAMRTITETPKKDLLYYDYELVISSQGENFVNHKNKKTKMYFGQELFFDPVEQRQYSNNNQSPLVLLRISYANHAQKLQKSQQPVTDFFQSINQWLR